jgi:hypothetical protein
MFRKLDLFSSSGEAGDTYSVVSIRKNYWTTHVGMTTYLRPDFVEGRYAIK